MARPQTSSLPLLLLLLLVSVGVIFSLCTPRTASTPLERTPAPVQVRAGAGNAVSGARVQEAGAPVSAHPVLEATSEANSSNPGSPEQSPSQRPPNDQPRSMLLLELNDPAVRSRAQLHGLTWSSQGVLLAAGAGEGQSHARTSLKRWKRAGRLELEPLRLEFPANAITPLWKGTFPADTGLEVEMRVSPDGRVWGAWHALLADSEAADSISPTLPDGRPNPSFGYVLGNSILQGLHVFQYVQVRVTLGADGEASPVLSSLRLFYQDTTLGQGAWMDPGQSLPTGDPIP